MSVEITLLGEVTARAGRRVVDIGTPRQRCVLAALAVDAGRVVPADRLLARVWGPDTPRRGRATLQTHISRLRGALDGAAAIVHRADGYALELDQPDQAIDLLRFHALRHQARDAGDDANRVALLTEALALWRGQPLSGLTGEWVSGERDRWQQEHRAAEHDLVDAQLSVGLGGELVAPLSARVTQQPLDERLAGQYMLVLHRAGRSADALAHYRQLRERLVEELGTEPGTALQGLHLRILAADPGLLRAAVSAANRTMAIPPLRGREDTFLREKAMPATSRSAVTQSMPRLKRRPLFLPAIFGVLVLVFTMARGATPAGPSPMTGLYNILLLPFDGYPSLERTLALEMEQWAHDEPILQTRGPSGVERTSDLLRLATLHNADVILTGRLDTSGDRWTVVVDVLLTARVFAETPEFVGHHELALTEPADVIRTNIELSQEAAGDVVEYVQAVVAFVRGLGRYALDDFAGAERHFRAAQEDLAMLNKARSPSVVTRTEVVLLMLGNTAGRAGRPEDAEALFRRALEQRPGYLRATVGLAEALRANGCRRNDRTALHQVLELYSASLTGANDALLEMKARLGLGVTYQCLSTAGVPHWAEADGQYAAVLRMQAASALTGEAGRQALRLAAEARAGQALTAWRQGRLDLASPGYEEAIALLHAIGVSRTTIHDRELTFLRNLRDVHRARNATAQADAVAERIRLAGGNP
jgi:DNA-binding SARP family transcriptional activator